MLLGELRRWGVHERGGRASSAARRRALGWIERYGDRDGDRFVEYQRATDRGLVNQGWKDSWDGVTFADGTARPRAHRALRGPGLRLRRLPRPRLLRPRGRRRRDWRSSGAHRAARTQGGVQRAVLAARPGLVRPRPRRRQAAQSTPRLQHGPLPVDRHRRRGQGARRSPSACCRRRCSPGGACAPSPPTWAPTTR